MFTQVYAGNSRMAVKTITEKEANYDTYENFAILNFDRWRNMSVWKKVLNEKEFEFQFRCLLSEAFQSLLCLFVSL